MPAPFTCFGIEIEYMIVNRESLDVLPAADRLLRDSEGGIANSVSHGDITWSNELVSHVLELKTTDPAPALAELDEAFHRSIQEANRRLAPDGACLLGGGMHPWFDPARESRLWIHEDREIYETFDRIFDCRGHGWSNLQSFHLNLPFGTDEDFRRLHSAIRLALPLIPVLAAASPIVDGTASGLLDTRLETYRKNCDRLPSVTAGVIPEVYRSEEEYRERVFAPIARDVAPFDPGGILDPEWTNARGAIARFDRGSIEVRLGDAQECPRRDLAIIRTIVFLARGLFEERWSSLESQEEVPTDNLRRLFLDAIREGRRALIQEPALLAAFGLQSQVTAAEAWGTLLSDAEESDWRAEAADLLSRGALAERILEATLDHSRSGLHRTWSHLRHCLADNVPFPSHPPA